MKFGDVESHQSPGCLIAGVQGSNCSWGCSIHGGSLTYCDTGMSIKIPTSIVIVKVISYVKNKCCRYLLCVTELQSALREITRGSIM